MRLVTERTAALTLSAAPLDEIVESLMKMPLPELRAQWAKWHPGVLLPNGLSRDLLVRSVAWTMQAQDCEKAVRKTLQELDRLAEQFSKCGELDLEREVRLKPGTCLVRDWRGRTYRVEVLKDGFLLDDRRYASLSHVARAVTGTRWSGPRFFGLKQRTRLSGKLPSHA
jgi:hypothetical protein